MHQGSDALMVEQSRYPFAGARNPTVRLGVADVGAALAAAAGDPQAVAGPPPPVWVDFAGGDAEAYLTRVHWLTADTLAVQVTDRAQQTLELKAFDVSGGSGEAQGGSIFGSTVLLTEKSDVWVNLHHMFEIFESDGQVGAGAETWRAVVSMNCWPLPTTPTPTPCTSSIGVLLTDPSPFLQQYIMRLEFRTHARTVTVTVSILPP